MVIGKFVAYTYINLSTYIKLREPSMMFLKTKWIKNSLTNWVSEFTDAEDDLLGTKGITSYSRRSPDCCVSLKLLIVLSMMCCLNIIQKVVGNASLHTKYFHLLSAIWELVWYVLWHILSAWLSLSAWYCGLVGCTAGVREEFGYRRNSIILSVAEFYSRSTNIYRS